MLFIVYDFFHIFVQIMKVLIKYKIGKGESTRLSIPLFWFIDATLRCPDVEVLITEAEDEVTLAGIMVLHEPVVEP